MKQTGRFLGIVLFLSACSSSQTSNEAAATSQQFTVHYRCAGGNEITVDYDNTDPEKSLAYVQLAPENPEKIKMTITRSASGARYTDGALVWWTKGPTAFLAEAGDEGKVLSDSCREYTETTP